MKREGHKYLIQLHKQVHVNLYRSPRGLCFEPTLGHSYAAASSLDESGLLGHHKISEVDRRKLKVHVRIANSGLMKSMAGYHSVKYLSYPSSSI